MLVSPPLLVLLSLTISLICRFVFWTEGNDPATSIIRRAGLNGTGVTNIATNVVNPSDLAIDVVRERLFWISMNGLQIRSVLFDGSEPNIVFINNLTHPFSGLAVFEDYIYTTVPARNAIARVDKFQREGTLVKTLRTATVYETQNRLCES